MDFGKSLKKLMNGDNLFAGLLFSTSLVFVIGYPHIIMT
jgi:hypothetical protein